MNVYILTSTIIFIVFSFLFKTNTVLNLIAKILMIDMALLGLFYTLTSYGFIVKI